MASGLLNNPEGTDVSFNNKAVDWAGARDAGVRHAYIRFGQRGLYAPPDQEDWKDSRRHENYIGAKEQGILVGPYYIIDERDGHNAQDHIDGYIYAFAPHDPLKINLPPVADVEVLPFDLDELKKFLEWLEWYHQMLPIIYTGSWVFQVLGIDPLPDWLKKYIYWLTGYNDSGPDLYGPLADLNPTVVNWQQSSTWSAPWCGLGKADHNYWISDLWRYIQMPDLVLNADDLLEWMQENAVECEEAPPPPPPAATGTFDLEMPLMGEPRLAQDFNLNYQWYSGIGGHDGLDWGIPVATPVFASHDGVVTVAGFRDSHGINDPYGWHVRIEQVAFDWNGQERKFTTIYAHLTSIEVVLEQKVFADTLVGGSGGATDDPRSGNSSGPHLHFGVILEGAYERKETYLKFDFVNPWIWLENWATEPIRRRRVKTNTWLNVRNARGLDNTVVRFTMNPLTDFDIWEDTGGDWPWGAQDISRTAWNSIHSNWTESI